jgi:molybdopterin-binding protein
MNSRVPALPPKLEARDLSVSLGGQTVLEIPRLQVVTNEVLVIIGPNGSGKTTLILTLAQLLKPTSGNILYEGQRISSSAEMSAGRRQFAVVFQEPLLLNTTVWDNVTLGLRLHRLDKKEIKLRTEKWLERFGIASLAQRHAKTLSGGEAKRTSLARAFVLQPDVLFLDEPFNGLDNPIRQALLEDFESVLRETKVTTVMITHDISEALAIAHRLIVLMNGHIRQIGSPEEIFSFPVDEEVARFVDAGNILHGTVVEQNNGLATINIAKQQVEAASELATGTEVTVLLRHHDITISLPPSGTLTTSARNHLSGNIVRVFPIGSQIRVTIDCGFPLIALITRHSWVDMGLDLGQKVIASFKASSIRLIAHKFKANSNKK